MFRDPECRCRQPMGHSRLPSRQLSSIPRQQDRDARCLGHDHQSRRGSPAVSRWRHQLRPKFPHERCVLLRPLLHLCRRSDSLHGLCRPVYGHGGLHCQRRDPRHPPEPRQLLHRQGVRRQGVGLEYSPVREPRSGGLGGLHGRRRQGPPHRLDQEPQLWGFDRLGH